MRGPVDENEDVMADHYNLYNLTRTNLLPPPKWRTGYYSTSIKKVSLQKLNK